MRGTMEERFWYRVDKNGPTMPNMETECWLWTGANNGRYGVIGKGGKKAGQTYAHRFACTLEHGPIPEKMNACHICDNPMCVRPDHTFIGSRSDNMQDCMRKGRWNTEIRGSRGERNGRCKLTDQQVEELRNLRGKGWVYSRLAERFNIGETQVARLVKREQRA